MYAVGLAGTVAHYNGSSWQKLESGTTNDIPDIYGATNPTTAQTSILAVASLFIYGNGLDLLSIQGNTVTKLDTAGLRLAESGTWFDPGKTFYVVGDGVFNKKDLAQLRWSLDETHPLLYKMAIRGNAWNDVFIVGSYGLVSHYNGSTWKHYTGSELPNLAGTYYRVAVKGSIVVAVGDLANGRAIVLTGIRHN